MPASSPLAVPATDRSDRPAGLLATLRRLAVAVRFRRPGMPPLGWRHGLTHFLRCTLHLPTYRRWLAGRDNPSLARELAVRPSLMACAAHPYLHGDWPATRKLATVEGHHALVRGPLAFLGVDEPASLPLASLADRVSIHLEAACKFDREGELTLVLRDGTRPVYWMAFTIGTEGGRRVAWIGALQGLHSPDALEVYRSLTHGMEGLRPRYLLILAFRHLCAAIGVERILAISDAHRVCSSAYFESRVLVFASYDEAWTDSGGTVAEGGFFELGLHAAERDAADIPSRKRAQYRRRYAMTHAMAAQIADSVRRLGERPVPA